jgi:hypothetical protein
VQDWTPPFRLYVVEFRTGVLKAGISAMPNGRRVRGLAAKHGPVVQHFISENEVPGFSVERELLARLTRIGVVHQGREWFTGVRFAQAVQLAKQVARSFVSSHPAVRSSVRHDPNALSLAHF